jgi:hypothetical protein
MIMVMPGFWSHHNGFHRYLVGGFNPSEKYEFVSWDDEIPNIWVWVNTYRYIFSGMNIHLPAILGFTRYQGFDPSPYGKSFKIPWFQTTFPQLCDFYFQMAPRHRPPRRQKSYNVPLATASDRCRKTRRVPWGPKEPKEPKESKGGLKVHGWTPPKKCMSHNESEGYEDCHPKSWDTRFMAYDVN